MGENTDLTNRFTDLKEHVTRIGDMVRDDVKQMVTKGEFTAEIGRLDANHHNLHDAHNKHVTATTDQLQRQAANTTDQFQKLGATIRWTLGFAVSFVGLSVAILKTIWP